VRRSPENVSLRPRARLFAAAPWLALVLLAARPVRANVSDASEAKKIFTRRCTACHTYGKGTKVGPDLKGVTERRTRPWLLRFVRSSQSVIKAGDPVASELFLRFKQQRMPDWTDLSPAQIGGLLDWLAARGPEQKEPDERDAALASAADLTYGRALFDGTTPLESGGIACASCHGLTDGGRARRGASLGPDLTGVYLIYKDRALTLFLKQPCTPRHPDHSAARYLTPRETFALKAYLRQIALAAPPTNAVVSLGTTVTRQRGPP